MYSGKIAVPPGGGGIVVYFNLQKHFSKDDFFWAEDFQRLKPEVFPHL
jgi:hypothetical protein